MTVDTYRIHYARTALVNLSDIESYIAAEGDPQVALGYVARIKSACESLRTFPRRHPRRDDVWSGLHVLGFEGRAVITYLVNDDNALVEIVGVHYGGQDWERLY